MSYHTPQKIIGILLAGAMLLPLLAVAALACTPWPKHLWQKLTTKAPWLLPVCSLGALVLCCAFLVDASYNPFLYFRF